MRIRSNLRWVSTLRHIYATHHIRHIYAHIYADPGVKIFSTLLIGSLGDCRDFIGQDSFDW